MPEQDEPRWGPATTYRAKPAVRRRAGGAAATAPPRPAASSPRDEGYDRSAYGYDDRRDDRYAEERYAAYDDGHDDGHDDEADYGSGTTYGRERPSGRRPRRRRRGRAVLLVVVLLLAVLVAYPVLLARTAMANVGRVDALSGSTLADTPGRTILVVGTDSREGTDIGGAQEISRTDTILLLHRPRNGPTVLLSIPRDSAVEVPGDGENKVNAAYAIGGPSLLVATVEQATGLHVDSYVETGLAGFGEVVDAVGGVTICPEEAMQDPLADDLDIQAGCQQADGKVALGYARSRKLDARGDLGRVERQREVMAAIAKKGFSPATVLNPFNAFPLAEAGGGALTMDEQDGATDLGWFLLAMRDSAGGEGISLTVPVADTTRRTEHGVVVDWDEAKSEQVFQALRDSSTESIRGIAEEQAAQAGG
jgi:LCP family protein required for cell wall assembly